MNAPELQQPAPAGAASGVSSPHGHSVPASSAAPIIEIEGLHKTYASGFKALDGVDLTIRRGEIFALLGPNGAGKSTLINLICGIVKPTGGRVLVGGHDIVRAFRKTRRLIGLVPQELSTDAFERVIDTVAFSRGLFGRPRNPAYIETILKDLSLWDKRGDKIMTLSGGMKRRVLIAKALSHEPDVLFLDEPTAGVDVELRQDMWAMVRRLRERGVTIILTTHYIEEAEEMADRIGIINKGRLMLVEDKTALIERLGSRRLIVRLQTALPALPQALSIRGVTLGPGGLELIYTYDAKDGAAGVSDLMRRLTGEGIEFRDLQTEESSLEEIFVGLIRSGT